MNKHQPARTCVGCRQVREKRELIRVVRTPTGEVTVDLTGKAQGRGAYLCLNPACLEKAWKRRRLEQALSLAAPLPAEIREILEEKLVEGDFHSPKKTGGG